MNTLLYATVSEAAFCTAALAPARVCCACAPRDVSKLAAEYRWEAHEILLLISSIRV
jgi:hypothetical protein